MGDSKQLKVGSILRDVESGKSFKVMYSLVGGRVVIAPFANIINFPIVKHSLEITMNYLDNHTLGKFLTSSIVNVPDEYFHQRIIDRYGLEVAKECPEGMSYEDYYFSKDLRIYSVLYEFPSTPFSTMLKHVEREIWGIQYVDINWRTFIIDQLKHGRNKILSLIKNLPDCPIELGMINLGSLYDYGHFETIKLLTSWGFGPDRYFLLGILKSYEFEKFEFFLKLALTTKHRKDIFTNDFADYCVGVEDPVKILDYLWKNHNVVLSESGYKMVLNSSHRIELSEWIQKNKIVPIPFTNRGGIQ